MSPPHPDDERVAHDDERIAAIAVRLREFIAGVTEVDPSAVPANMPLLNGRVDSTALMELLTFLEDEFDVVVEYTDIHDGNLGSIDRVARYVERRRAHP